MPVAPKELNTSGGSNRFKFQSFIDRIKAIDVDVIHRVGTVQLQPEDGGSFFNEGLQHWRELNCTTDFALFHRDICRYTNTFNQVLFHRDTIVQILIKHLRPTSLAAEPIVSLVALLANDLRHEFYPFFGQFTKALVDVLRGTQDAKLIESVFHALGFMYKYLRKELVRDIQTTFTLIAPLLSERQSYIRWFAGPGFAFLMRKLDEETMASTLSFIADSFREQQSPEYVEGVAILLFETVKGPKQTFHSKMPMIIRNLILLLKTAPEDVQSPFQSALEQLLSFMINHGSIETNDILLRDMISGMDLDDADIMAPVFSLLALFSTLRSGKRISSYRPILEVASKSLLLLKTAPQSSRNAFVGLMSTLITNSPLPDSSTVLSLLSSLNETLDTTSILRTYFSIVLFAMCRADDYKGSEFYALVFRSFMAFVSKLPKDDSTSLSSVTVVLSHWFRLGMVDQLRNEMSVCLPGGQCRVSRNLIDFWVMYLSKSENIDVDVAGNLVDAEQNDVRNLNALLMCLNHFDVQPHEDGLCKLVDGLVETLLTKIEMSENDSSTVLAALLRLAVEFVSRKISLLSDADDKWQRLTQHVINMPNDRNLLKACLVLAQNHPVQFPDTFVKVLSHNLRSSLSPIRKISIDLLLVAFPKSSVFSIIAEMLHMEVTIQSFRSVHVVLRRLETALNMGSSESSGFGTTMLEKESIYNAYFGLLTINFQPLWSEVMRIIGTMVKRDDVMWSYWTDEIQRFDRDDDSEECQLYGLYKEWYNEHSERIVVPNIKPKKVDEQIDKSAILHRNIMDYMQETSLEKLGCLEVLESCKLQEMMTERFDTKNYHELLMKTLIEYCPEAAERRAQGYLADKLIEFYNAEFGPEVDDEADIHETRWRLRLSLQLFSKFRAPKKSLPNHYEKLYEIYLILLSKTDAETTSLALECIMTYKLPHLNPYEELLRNIVSEKTFRDTLSSLSVDEERSLVSEKHREHVFSIIIRILHGKMVKRKASKQLQESSGSQNIGAKRTAIASFLAGCTESERKFFIDLSLQPFQKILDQYENGDLVDTKGEFILLHVSAMVSTIPLRKQIGFLHHMEDLCKQVGSLLIPFLDRLLAVITYLLTAAQNRSTELRSLDQEAFVGFEMKQIKEVRSLAYRRLTDIFSMKMAKNEENQDLVQRFDFQPFMTTLFRHNFSSRIEVFDQENTQAVSPIMELFFSWSLNIYFASFLIDYDKQLLRNVLNCISAPNVKPAVIRKILDMLENIIQLSDDGLTLGYGAELLRPYADVALDNIEKILTSNVTDSKSNMSLLSRDVITRKAIFILSEMAANMSEPEKLERVTLLLLPFLRKPPQVVGEKMKVHIFKIILQSIDKIPLLKTENVKRTPYFSTVTHAFANMSSRDARKIVCEVFEKLASLDHDLVFVSSLISSLNAFSTERLDEPDWDKRLQAFNTIAESAWKTLTPTQWTPLLQNLLFYMHDVEEISIRGNASSCVVSFLTAAQNCEDPILKEEFTTLITCVMQPAIKRAMQSHNEIIRREFIVMLGKMVQLQGEFGTYKDMVCLLVSGDEEANFFTNIYHVQIHRRRRAIRRLVDEVEAEKLDQKTIMTILLPLVSHFVFECNRQSEHLLVDESIQAIGTMVKFLTWNQYYNLLKHYFRLVERKPDLERVLIRTIVAILSGFHWDLKNVDAAVAKAKFMALTRPKTVVPIAAVADFVADDVEMKETVDKNVAEVEQAEAAKEEDDKNTMEVDQEEASKEDDAVEEMELDQPIEEFAEQENSDQLTLDEKIHNIVLTKILPDLFKFLSTHKEGDAKLNIRVPIAIAYTRLLLVLPEASMNLELPRLLTTVCQILKSKNQENRDSTRDTIVKISKMLGVRYLSFVIKELQTALQNGYQLHILGFTIADLLARIEPDLSAGDLDSSLHLLINILVRDIFSIVSEEKRVSAVANKMKETKSKRTFDTFEIVARYISFDKTERILKRLKEVLTRSSSTRTVNSAKEILRRIAIGIHSNGSVNIVDFSVFTFQMMAEEGPLFETEDSDDQVVEQDNFAKNFTVQTFKRTEDQLAVKNHFKFNSYLFVEFGFSLLLSCLKRGRFDAQDEQHLELLDTMVEALCDALCSKRVEIISVSLKILCILFKWRLASLPTFFPTCLDQCMRIIQRATTAANDMVQNCLKLITVILRDDTSLKITDKHLILILNLIRPDLEELERQHTSFSLVRVLITRKFMVPEMYDLMDLLAKMMVTSQLEQVRHQCRVALMQFLLEYPMGHDRVQATMGFFIKNTSFVHESGRVSVCEFLNNILQKFPDELVEEYAEMIFLASVVRLAQDESSQCREMYAMLIKQLVLRVNRSKAASLVLILKKWGLKRDNLQLTRLSFQTIGLLFDAGLMDSAFGKWIKDNYLESVISSMDGMLAYSVKQQNGEEEEAEETLESTTETLPWQVVYYTIQSFEKALKAFPFLASDSITTPIWEKLTDLLLFPHSWVRIATTRSFQTYLLALDPATFDFKDGLECVFSNQPNTYLNVMTAVKSVANKLAIQLTSQHLTEQFGTVIVKCLFLIGKHFALPSASDNIEKQDEEDPTENDKEESDTKSNDYIGWLFRRLSFLSRKEQHARKKPLARTCVFRWFAAMANVLSSTQIQPHLIPILLPLYRTSIDEGLRGKENEALKQLAVEVLDFVEQKVGGTLFFEKRAEVERHVAKVRDERRRKEKIEAVVNPVQHAKRKVKENLAKRDAKKRKMAEISKRRIKTRTIRPKSSST